MKMYLLLFTLAFATNVYGQYTGHIDALEEGLSFEGTKTFLDGGRYFVVEGECY